MFGTLFTRSRKTESSNQASSNHDVGETRPTQEVGPGGLSCEEGAAGGLGRHLGVTSCTLLIVGRIIGTGIFSTPSFILNTVGSVGASLLLWVLGFILSFCGLFIWLEFGTMYPRSGGEKVYLEAVYQRPKYLATAVFAANAILLGFNASGCLVFASYILDPSVPFGTNTVVRSVALVAVVSVTILHAFVPRIGIYIMNFLTICKITILLIIVVTGWVVLSGNTSVSDPGANFVNAFSNSSNNTDDYATATLQVLYAYEGWSNANYILNNVQDPVRTLKIAGPLGLGICALFYLLTNIAYFSAVSTTDIESSGLTVASTFFSNVFGQDDAGKAMTILVALSALGNVVTVMFAAARVNQELAKEGIPLPFGNKFWASNWPTGKSPLPGLVIYLIPAVIVILLPISTDAVYAFLIEMNMYGNQVIGFFIVVALFWMRWKRPDIPRPFKVWLPLAGFYLITSGFLIVAPFSHPSRAIDGRTHHPPYYLYPLVSVCVLLSGVVYWAAWRILLPKVFGIELVPRKETLGDGTVVTLFSRRKIK